MIPKTREQGFVLLDVVFALFLFGLGFTALYGLTEGANQETQQVFNRTEAANRAQNLMENLSAHSWSENLAVGRCIPGGSVEGRDGQFQWEIVSDWEIPSELLRVQVIISWRERGKVQNYALHTFFFVP